MKRLLLRPVRPIFRAVLAGVLAGALACSIATAISSVIACADSPVREGAIVVFNAGALGRPLRVALDSFSAANHLRVEQENAGSIETVRKLTELHRTPDVLALADTALYSRLLPGAIEGPVTPLGRTRMVLAYSPRSQFAGEITPANWYRVLSRRGVEVGRSDPALDPAGYRALMVMQLAERYYGIHGLAARLEAAANPRNIRPKSADLVALLQTGNLDYAWEYESVACSARLAYVRLPREIDLGEPGAEPIYRTVTVTVRGRAGGDSVRIRGAPIVFGAATPVQAPNGDVGRRFITYLMSPAGRAILAAYQLETMDAGSASETR